MRDKGFCPASKTNSKLILLTCGKNLLQSNDGFENCEIPTCGDFRMGMSSLIMMWGRTYMFAPTSFIISPQSSASSRRCR